MHKSEFEKIADLALACMVWNAEANDGALLSPLLRLVWMCLACGAMLRGQPEGPWGPVGQQQQRLHPLRGMWHPDRPGRASSHCKLQHSTSMHTLPRPARRRAQPGAGGARPGAHRHCAALCVRVRRRRREHHEAGPARVCCLRARPRRARQLRGAALLGHPGPGHAGAAGEWATRAAGRPADRLLCFYVWVGGWVGGSWCGRPLSGSPATAARPYYLAGARTRRPALRCATLCCRRQSTRRWSGCSALRSPSSAPGGSTACARRSGEAWGQGRCVSGVGAFVCDMGGRGGGVVNKRQTGGGVVTLGLLRFWAV